MRSPIAPFAVAVAICATSLASSTLAADAKPDDKKPADSTDASATTTTTATETASGGAEVSTSEAAPAPSSLPAEKMDSSDPHEIPGKTYYFVGLRYINTILPKFMLNLFVDGGPKTVDIHTFGVEGGMRKDGFDIIGAITYSSYAMDPFPFKGKSEADTAYEIVTSNLKLINFTVDFLWSAGDHPSYQFQYGVTTGLALVLGDLGRVQGKPPTGSAPGDPYTYVPCAGQNDPQAPTYCDTSNNHYGDYKEPSWFNGGSKPNIYAVFGPQIGFRWKPVKQFVARITAGFNIFTGFFFGIAGNYGI